jgi:hypothetical protein
VGRLSGRNNAQQRDTTLTNDKQCGSVALSVIGHVLGVSAWFMIA